MIIFRFRLEERNFRKNRDFRKIPQISGEKTLYTIMFGPWKDEHFNVLISSLQIPDPTAVKPVPPQIVDPSAVKPEDWLDDEDDMISRWVQNCIIFVVDLLNFPSISNSRKANGLGRRDGRCLGSSTHKEPAVRKVGGADDPQWSHAYEWAQQTYDLMKKHLDNQAVRREIFGNSWSNIWSCELIRARFLSEWW